jgi:hypothetical protein
MAMTTIGTPVRGLGAASGQRLTGADALLDQLAHLPNDLALTAVGRKKAAYLADWQKKGLSRDRLMAEINSGRAIAIGVICGPLSGGVLIVDHDGASAGPLLQELMGGEKLPPTWVWSSGRPGRWAAAFRVPEHFWPAMKGIWEQRTRVKSPDDPAGKVEGLELRWAGHYSVIVGAHPLTEGYSWFPDCSPADLAIAEAPLPLIEALLKEPEPFPLLKQSTLAPSSLRLPLLEFVSLETRQFVETGGVPGQWNDDQLTHSLDLLGTEAWILKQGHIPEPSARNAFAEHIEAAIQQNASFERRKAWRRYEGAEGRDPHPSTPLVKLQERLDWHVNRASGDSGRKAPANRSKGDGRAAAPTPATRPNKPNLSPQEKLTVLRGMAADLLEQSTAFADRVPLLRARAEELDLTLRDQELLRLLWDARRAASGADQLLVPGNRIDLTQTRWVWEGIIMPAAANLLVGLPKTGKTALMLAMLGAWHRGEPSFLGQPLFGPCPPVLIVGTDQPQSDWGRMMLEVGLIGSDGVIQAPVVGLAHAGRPLHLSPEGIERIETYAAAHPGLFVLVDSLAAAIGPLGLREKDEDFAEPIRDLMEALEPHGATLLAVHHSGKERAGDRASLASRGTTALPAAVSQNISLAPMPAGNPAGPPERRVTLKTEGRGGLPQHLLIERTTEGWISHGSAESVALAQHLQELEEKLSDRQAEALEVVRHQWMRGERMEAKGLAIALALEKDGDRIARRTLDQLVRRGLLQSAMEVGLQGRTKWFWPVDTDPPAEARTPTYGDTYTLSEVSEPSYLLPDQIVPSPTTKKTKDTSDRKDRQKPITRKNWPDIPAPGPADLATAPCRISCMVNGEVGWSRKTGPMPRLSVFVTHDDGRQLSAGPDQVTDLPHAC